MIRIERMKNLPRYGQPPMRTVRHAEKETEKAFSLKGIEYGVEYGFCASKPAGAGGAFSVLFFPPPASEPAEQSVPDACRHGYRNDRHGYSGHQGG